MEITYTKDVQTGPIASPDGNRAPFRGGSYGELVSSNLWGDYAELCRRGMVFAGIGAAAAAVPIATTLTNSPTLWNPADSGKIVVPLRVLLSLGAIGTPILQGFAISYLVNTGSVAGTGLPHATFTNIAPICTLLGKGTASTTKFSGAVVTFTVNPARLMDLGFGHHLEGAAASGQLYSQFYHDFNGSLILPPGTSVSLGSTIATSTTYWTTILFAEIAVPLGF